MQDTYRGFVRQNSDRFAELFGHLLESNEPTVSIARRARTARASPRR